MKLLHLLKKESGEHGRPIVFYASLSGIANTVLIALINTLSEQDSFHLADTRTLALFVLALAIYIISLKKTFDLGTSLFEKIILRLRVRLCEKIRDSELTRLDEIGQAALYNRLTQEMIVISESQRTLTAALQSVVLVVFVFIYIGLLSGPAFIITVAFITVSTKIFFDRQEIVYQLIERANNAEVRLFNMITHLIRGFNQVKIHRPRGDDLLRDIALTSENVAEERIEMSRVWDTQHIHAQASFYILTALLAFLLPRIVTTDSDILNHVITAVIFMIGPLSMVITGASAYTRAEKAVTDVYSLEEKLDHGESIDIYRPKWFFKKDFEAIHFKNVMFEYPNKKGVGVFRVGPLNFTIKQGEITFITGGNGSGKSTTLKLLTGLYRPLRGVIEVGDLPLSDEELEEYRPLFSTVFADFYLFEKLYGIGDVPQETIDNLLKTMDIVHKTQYDGDRFTNLELSTGQRSRLALIVALFEDRPIYVFDEWAADQDPGFRKYFYREFLPAMKARKKTVVAVTHDDRYFDVADHLLKMEEGEVRSIRPASSEEV